MIVLISLLAVLSASAMETYLLPNYVLPNTTISIPTLEEIKNVTDQLDAQRIVKGVYYDIKPELDQVEKSFGRNFTKCQEVKGSFLCF